MGFLGDVSINLGSGGAAGLSVDLILFPMDTIKTRLQSSSGFWKAGGFGGIYRGIGAVATGAAPGAGLFFATYETVKTFAGKDSPYVHMFASSCGEVVACLVRVPTENVKQNMQVQKHTTSAQVMRHIVSSEGIGGLWRGYTTTVMREIPFSVIQFPIFEALKRSWAAKLEKPLTPVQGAACGAVAGAIAAAITTPIDVAKTRIMLRETDAAGRLHTSMLATIRSIHAQHGTWALFRGVVPRTLWMTIGGFVYFGAYEQTKHLLTNL